MKKGLIHIFILAFYLITQAYSAIPDSIESKLAGKSKKEQVEFLMALTDQFPYEEHDIINSLLTRADTLATFAASSPLRMQLDIKIASYLMERNQLDSAISLLETVKTESGKIQNRKLEARASKELGVAYYYAANDQQALENSVHAYRIFESNQDTANLASLSNNIGAMYRLLGDLDNAIDMYRKAIHFKKFFDRPLWLSSSYHNLAIAFDESGQLDSARKYAQKALNIRIKENSLRGMALSNTFFGVLYEKELKLDSSIIYFSNAISIDEQLKDTTNLTYDLSSRASVNLKKGNYIQAIKDADRSQAFSPDIETVIVNINVLGDAWKNLGRYKKAVEYKDQYLQLRDSVDRAEKEASLQQLQVQFETELKQKEIEALEADKVVMNLKIEKEQQVRYTLLLVAVALIILASLLFLLIRNTKKANSRLDFKNQELNRLNRTKDRLFSIISHDLKNPLSSFHMITKSLSENWDKLDQAQIREYLLSLKDSSADVRDMMENLLRWALVQTNELNYKIQDINAGAIIEKVKKQLLSQADLKKIKINHSVVVEKSIPADQQFLEIVIRNLLSNALKFSKMESEINVLMEEKDTQFVIAIQDQGVGMDQQLINQLFEGKISALDINNSSDNGTGLGLTVCKELMNKMGGVIQVNSQIGKGTKFELIFPKNAA